MTKYIDLNGNSNTGDMKSATYDAAAKEEQVLTVSDILDEDNMASDSATKVASQQSVKAYVDNNAGGGAWQLISSATASSSSEVAFTSNIDSTYDVYVFIGVGIAPATDDVGLVMTVSHDGGSTYASTNYDANLHIRDESGVADNTGDTTQWSIAGNNTGQNIGNASGEAVDFEVRLYTPSNAAIHRFMGESTWLGTNTVPHRGESYGCQKTTSAINAVKFTMTSGNIASGTFYMYGIKKS